MYELCTSNIQAGLGLGVVHRPVVLNAETRSQDAGDRPGHSEEDRRMG